ncbi:TrgA family protein [Defluviimonas sp. WL0050]|uniref:TrgA family protein n=1 Tax=Albidovulum litorale TaxID=2984134 RepID=A0ABT2ZNZ8_9RHOB|nr:TrgA family protein [Defluviimonas sp. WL0050]MCV2872863.1 TrgA family protein [Defluviimonas sp. WL0050]
MPTAAKLFAAFAFAIVAFFTAEVFKPHMPEGTQFGYFSLVSALIGAICGWKVMGPEAGRGNLMALSSGMKTALFMALVALFVFSTYEMLREAFRPSYSGPMEAVVAIFEFAVDYFVAFLAWDVLIVLFVGGALAGSFSEWAARRWR